MPRPPKIPADLAAGLAAEAERVAQLGTGTCAARDAAARLQRDVIRSIGEVPQRYREDLLGAATDLADRLSQCSEQRRREEKEHDQKEEKAEKEHGKGHGKKHGKGG